MKDCEKLIRQVLKNCTIKPPLQMPREALLINIGMAIMTGVILGLIHPLNVKFLIAWLSEQSTSKLMSMWYGNES